MALGIENLIRQTAAVRSSDDLLIAFTQAGFSEKQTVAVRDANVEFLTKNEGYMARAHCHLANAGFTRNEREELIGTMAEATHHIG